MREIVKFLIDAHIMDFATDPRVMFTAGALFLLSVFMKWKYIAVSLFGAGALVAVVHYSQLAEGRASLDQNLIVFSIGSFLVVVVVIYFLFIRGD